MRCSRIFFAVVVSAACSSATEPTSPGIVPAGSSDPAWASSVRRARPRHPSPPSRALDSTWVRRLLTDQPYGRRRVGGHRAASSRRLCGSSSMMDPVIFLVDTTQRQQAFAGLQGRLSVPGGLAVAKVRAARWNFAELADWYRYLQVQPFGAQISFCDIDEAKNRITFGVPTRPRVRRSSSRSPSSICRATSSR